MLTKRGLDRMAAITDTDSQGRVQ